MGLDTLVFSRMHYKIKNDFRENKHLEFVWKTKDYPDDDILVHLMYDMYYSPKGFEFDDYFNDE